MKTLLTLSLLLLASFNAEAATEYEFSITSEGSYPLTRSGRIVIDGERWRMDLSNSDAVRAHDSVLQAGEGHVIALNHENHTWYELSGTAAVHIQSLFDFHRSRPTRASDLKVEPLPAAYAEEEAKSFQYKTRTDISGEIVRGAVSGTVVRTRSPDLTDRRPMELLFGLTTGTELADQFLKEAVASGSAACSRVELMIRRQLDGGTAMTQTIRWTVRRVRTIATDSATFEIPRDYTNQVPQLGFPG